MREWGAARRAALAIGVGGAALLACRGERAPEGDASSGSAAAAGASPIGCRETTPPRAAVDGILEDLRGRRRFACVLRPGTPPTEVTLVGDSIEPFAARRLELRDGGEARPRQVLEATGEMTLPPHGAEFLRAEDLDGDGTGELLLLTVTGASGNQRWLLWRAGDAAGRFVADPGFEEITSPRAIPGRPCVASHAVGGSAGMTFEDGEWCLVGGSWVPVRTVSQAPDPRLGRFVRTTRERRGGRLVVVGADTLAEE